MPKIQSNPFERTSTDCFNVQGWSFLFWRRIVSFRIQTDQLTGIVGDHHERWRGTAPTQALLARKCAQLLTSPLPQENRITIPNQIFSFIEERVLISLLAHFFSLSILINHWQCDSIMKSLTPRCFCHG